MVSVTDKPKAASMFLDSLKNKTTAMQPNISNQLIAGIYSWPFTSDGNTTLNLGQRFNRIASATNVNEPLINACEAMIVAIVATTIAGKINQSGTNPKN